MGLYRILTPLSYHGQIIPAGKVYPLDFAKDKALILQQVGAIAPVYAPPLSVLPGWDKRAAALAPHNIITIDQFWETPDQTLASLLSESCDTIKTFKTDALSWLEVRS
jgi:hypothetical protein